MGLVYKYTLDSSEKFDCPSCGHTNRFVRYRNVITGEWVDGSHGKCDRENSCGHWVVPSDNKPVEDKSLIKIETDRSIWIGSTGDDLSNKYYSNFVKGELGGVKYENNFMVGIRNEFGIKEAAKAYRKYKLGTFYDGGVIFPYYAGRHMEGKEVGQSRLVTGKIMWYDDNLHRYKEGKKSYPRWLHNFDYVRDNGEEICSNISPNYMADYGFFGYHYDMEAKPTRNIGMVESEKTAIIMSIVYPKITWVATGGLNQIQQRYKWRDLLDMNIIVLPDYGIIKKTNQTTAEYWEEKIIETIEVFAHWYGYTIVDYIPPYISDEDKYKLRDKGIDVADLVLANKKEYIPYINKKLDKYIK